MKEDAIAHFFLWKFSNKLYLKLAHSFSRLSVGITIVTLGQADEAGSALIKSILTKLCLIYLWYDDVKYSFRYNLIPYEGHDLD